jgi:sugar phosphate isomerase/epimerase
MKHRLTFLMFIASMACFAQEIGIQLYSVRNQNPADIKATLAMIKSWGITQLEGGGTYGLSSDEFLKLCEETGLKLVSIGADFSELETDVAKVIERAKAMNVQYVVCYWLPHEGNVFTLADADRAIAVLNSAGMKLSDNGINLFYHPHGYEFTPLTMDAAEFKERLMAERSAREEAQLATRAKSDEGKMGKATSIKPTTVKPASKPDENSLTGGNTEANKSNQQSTPGDYRMKPLETTQSTTTNPDAGLNSAKPSVVSGALFDYMVALLDKKYLNFELDVYWVKQAGVDPVALLQKYPTRFKMLHLKDRQIGTPNSSDGHADVETNVVLGKGDVNIAEVMRVARAIGIEYYFIEDESSRVTTQVPESVRYLKSLKN